MSSTANTFSLPPSSSRKRKIIYTSSDGTFLGRQPKQLSTLRIVSPIDQGFVFELRDPVPLPANITIKSKPKQVLNFKLFDSSNKDFEVSIWEPRVNSAYEMLSQLKLPHCVYFSHVRVQPPSNKHRPKTAIKNLCMTVPHKAVIAKSDVAPLKTTKKHASKCSCETKCIGNCVKIQERCDCLSTCDRSCRIPTPESTNDFVTIASKVGTSGKTILMRKLELEIYGIPTLDNDRLTCNVTDGKFLARYEGRAPDFDIGDGTAFCLDVFSARFYYYAPGKMTLLIIPHENRAIHHLDYQVSTADNESFRLITPSDI